MPNVTKKSKSQKPEASQNPSSEIKPKVMSITDAGLYSDNDNWIKPEEYFENEDDDFSQPFYIVKANMRSGKYGQQVVFSLKDSVDSKETYLCSLASNDERAQYADFYRTTRVAILGPNVFKRLDTDYENSYYKIVPANEATEI